MSELPAPERADIVVVGAGILGLATAVELLRRRPDWAVLVVEKERAPALHQTGRSSGVIHAGVYYQPGSLKARLCTRGRELLLEFCDEEGVPYDICGKVIVAADESERPALDELHRRALANGVPVGAVDGSRLRELEPHCSGVSALHVPTTGLVDFQLVADALARRLERLGGRLVLETRVERVEESARCVRVKTSRGTIEASYAVSCAGVQADRVAGRSAGGTAIVPFRGDYFALRPEARGLCRNLIYPVPDPRFPFLGVHVNRRHDGEVWAGPNAVVALAREGYRRRDVNLRDAWETLSSRAFRRLVRRYWRLGILELYRDLSRRAYAAQARRYLPELEADDLVTAPAGIRAQALAPDGTLVDDFLFVESARVVHVQNAPSPGATSSLAIAAHIADRALALFVRDAAAPAPGRTPP
jgi:(S)-2-hydroxyglutarate dehydrogenase